MSNSEKFESVKKEIRALLISSQTGIPLYNFPRDYYDIVGVALDFQELGFFDLEAFLKAIPDVVRITTDHNGQKILKYVSSESTKHIEKLVERQKPKETNKSKKTRGGYGLSSFSSFFSTPNATPNGFYNSSRYSESTNSNNNHSSTSTNKKTSQPGISSSTGGTNRSLLPPPFLNGPSSKTNNSYHPCLPSSSSVLSNKRSGVGFSTRGSAVTSSSSSSVSSSSRVRPPTHCSSNNTGDKNLTFRPPSLPSSIRAQIRLILAPYSEPVSQSTFETAFKKNYGAYLNYEKCGFGSMDELFQSIPNIVKRTVHRNGEFYYNLVPGPGSKQSDKTSPFSPKSGFTSSPSTNTNLQTHSKSFSTSMGGSDSLSTAPSGSKYLNHSSFNNNKKNRDSKSPTPRVSPSNGLQDVTNDDEDADWWIDDFEMSVNPGISRKIEKVLQNHPNGLYASMLCSEYKSVHQQDLDYRELGYLSVIDLVSKLKSVRIVRPTASGDWLLFDAQKPVIAVDEVVDKIRRLELSKTCLVKEKEKDVRLKISKMLERIPDGVNLDQFMDVYKKETGDYFTPEDVGFRSLESYILSLASNIVEISYTGNACLTIKSLKVAKPERNADSSIMKRDSQIPKHPTNYFSSLSSGMLPEDAVGPGVSYRLLDLCSDGQHVEVFVSNIDNPGHFWIQFRGKKHSVALEKLMDDLESLYCSCDSKSYHVPDDFIQVGLVAAAVYPEDQNWHRVLITSVPNLSYVEVYFVDYGNTCIVPRIGLRLLRRDFLSLPMQAVQARLANVKPIGDKWTLQSRNRMLKLCFSKPLVALVTKVKDSVMSLCLINTSQSNVDIHINDLLVNEEYCYFSPDETESTKSPGSATVDSCYYSSCESPASISSLAKSPTPGPQPHEFRPIVTKPEPQEEKDLNKQLLTEKVKPCVSRPTSIQKPSPCASPTFDSMNNLKHRQSPKLMNLTLNPSNHFQSQENIARPTSISTKLAARLTPTNNFMLHGTSLNNHVTKIDYPISKGNKLKPFVKKLQLTEDYAVHIFNLNGTACISSCDLSAFLWKIDIVRTMLRTVNLGISKVIICEEDYPELFSELKRINFSGLWDGEERKDWVTLFRLEDVPVVLETFNHPSTELKMAVQIAIRNFDPHNEFWTGNHNNPVICKPTQCDDSSISLPISKQSSPLPIPKSVCHKLSPTVYSEQLGLSSSASPPQFYYGRGSPSSQRNELRISSTESSPRSRRSSAVTLEDIKTINNNLTHLHKLRQCILNKMEKGNCPYDSYVTTLESVESKLQKLNALLIQASPTAESKDPPGLGRLISPYQPNTNTRLTPSPAGSMGFSPRESKSVFHSPSPSPTNFDSWGERKSPWPTQLRPFQRLYSPPSFPLKVPESTPLTPQILTQMLDSQYAALFAASGTSATPSDPLVAVRNTSYSTGLSSCASSLLNTPASPFSPSRHSPSAKDPTGILNPSGASPKLMPALYPLLHQQPTLTCLGRGSAMTNLSVSPPIWGASSSLSPGFLGANHSPSRNQAFNASLLSPHSLTLNKGK